MRKVLFVSPHLDDAVFSCAARISQETNAGAKVIVATVFSHARPRSGLHAEYTARHEDDRRAVSLLGAKPLWLGLLDAPCRNPFYNSFRHIVLETAPGDWEYVRLVREKIARLVDDMAPDAVYLPLGVGSHIDHRLVFEAGTALPATSPRYFYEDQPYALVRHAIDARMREIEAARISNNGGSEYVDVSKSRRQQSFLKSFRAAPYVRRYLPAGKERRECEALLCKKLFITPSPNLWLQRENQIVHDFEQKQILGALYAYRSQARLFLGSQTQLLAACRSHARWLKLKCWRAETFWSPVKSETTPS
jgi:LmbE family N-acetylglucosaminyl deacetylase